MSKDTDFLLAEYTRKLASYTLWLMVAALLSLGCTLWIAWSTKQLRDFAEEQARDMKDQIRITREAINAANRQALAAEQANIQTRESTRRQLRPELVPVSIERPNQSSDKMISTMQIKNVGLTAAYDVRTDANEAIVGNPSDNNFKPPKPFESGSPITDQPARTVGATVQFGNTNVSRLPYSQNDLLAFRRGDAVYMVWGIAQYRDYENVAHFLRYCAYFRKGNLDVFTYCDLHNDTN